MKPVILSKASMGIQQTCRNVTQHRPPGVTIIGYLTIFSAVGRLFSPFNRPMLVFGVIHHGLSAGALRISAALLGIYLGFGILKCFRHIWYVYIAVACAGMMNIALTLTHESKMWELFLLLRVNMAVIPRFIRVVHVTQILLAIIYAYAAWYIYAEKEAFLGETEL